MEIKFRKGISDFKYLVMFDLASKITGICLWDLKARKPIETKIIKVTGKTELDASELWDLIDQYFYSLNERNISFADIFVSFEAAPCQIRSGAASTIQTFIALAQAHAILNLYLFKNNIAVYDYIGVYPITTHAYLKKINEWDKDHPVTKEDIKARVENEYKMSNLTLDESDAVFLAKTLIESKWNKDIEERIREEKRHRKTLKMDYCIKTCDEEISRLEGLKIN